MVSVDVKHHVYLITYKVSLEGKTWLHVYQVKSVTTLFYSMENEGATHE